MPIFPAVLFALALVLLMTPGNFQRLPRGIRNNNPGNIRISADNWRGKTGDDGQFIIFEAPQWGIRAMARILRSYGNRGVITLRAIINTWAPPSGRDANGKAYSQDTSAYLTHVADLTGIDPDEAVTPDRYADLIAAMIRHENGMQPYPAHLIAQGIALA